MIPYYHSYSWKNGLPVGNSKTQDPTKEKSSYAILSDPYRKRLSIEKYTYGKFDSVIYDSNLLDFRQLHPSIQERWLRETLDETPDTLTALVRDENHRAILIEEHDYKKSRCSFLSPLEKKLLGYQEILEDCAILYDSEGMVVLEKKTLFR